MGPDEIERAGLLVLPVMRHGTCASHEGGVG
jgi:hypothetical protein